MGVQLANAWVNIVPSTKDIAPAVKKSLGEVDKVAASSGKSLGDKLSSAMTKTLKGGAIAAGGAIAGTLGTAMWKGLGRLTAIENAQAKLRGLGNDAEATATIMENANAAVKGTAFGLDAAATTAAGAVAAGIKPGRELEGVLKSVANSAAATGMEMDDMGGIFNKVASIGKAQNDTLMQVANAGLPIYQALADQFHVTADEVFDMASKGEIGFADFEKAMKSAGGTVADELGQTMTGAMDNFGAALGRLGATAWQPLFDSAPVVISSVGSIFDSINEGLKGPSERLTNVLTPAFTGLAGVIENTVAPALGNFFGWLADKAVTGIEWLTDPERMQSAWDKAVGVFERVKSVWDEISEPVTNFAAAIGRVSGQISEQVWEAFANVLEALAPILNDVVVPALERLADFISDHPQLVGSAITAFVGFKVVGGIIGGILSPFSGLLSILKKIGTIVAISKFTKEMGALAKATEKSNPALSSFARMGNRVGKAFNPVPTVMQKVPKAIKPIGGAVKGVLGVMNPWVLVIGAVVAALVWFFTKTETGQKIIQWLWDKMKAFGEWLSNVFANAWDKVKEKFESAINWIKDAWNGLKALFVDGDFTGALGRAFGLDEDSPVVDKLLTFRDKLIEIFDSIKEKVSTVFDFFKGDATGMDVVSALFGEDTAEKISTAIEVIRAPIDTLVEWWSSIWESIKTVFSTAWEIIQDVWATAFQVLKDVFTGNWDHIGETLKAGWETIKGHFMDGVERIKEIWTEWVDNLVERVTSLWDSVKSGISNMWEGVKNWFIQGVTTTVSTIINWKNQIVDKFNELVAKAIAAVVNMYHRVTQWIHDMKVKAISTVIQWYNAFTGKVNDMVEKVLTYILSLKHRIPEAFHGAIDWLRQAGADILNGLWNGMKSVWSSISGWIDETVGKIRSWFSRADAASSRRIGMSSHADGSFQSFADGGTSMPRHATIQAPVGKRGLIQWAEQETGGEAFIPLALSKRARSTKILATVADHFGLTLVGRDGQHYERATERELTPTRVGVFADGGITAKKLLDFAAGKNVDGHQAARSLEGAGYVLGGSNWGDCSGAMSSLAALVAGITPFPRKFATMNEGPVLSSMGFKPGRSSGKNAFEIGFYNGGAYGGHTSGTIYDASGNGTNVEMGGGRGNGQIGGGAAGARHSMYTDHYFATLGDSVADKLEDATITSTSVDGVTVEDSKHQVAEIDWKSASSLVGTWEKMLERNRKLGKLRGGVFDTGGILPSNSWAFNAGGPERVLPASTTKLFDKFLQDLPPLLKNMGKASENFAKIGSIESVGGNVGMYWQTTTWSDKVGLADQVGQLFGVDFIGKTFGGVASAYDDLEDAYIMQMDAADGVSQAEKALAEARASGDVDAVTAAEKQYAEALNVTKAAAANAGNAQIQLALAVAQMVIGIIKRIGQFLKDLWESQVKAQAAVTAAIGDSLKAVYDWSEMVEKQRESVSKLQQQFVNDQIALRKATWDVRLAQVGIVRSQLEGIKSVAEAEAKLQAERERVARAQRNDWNDLTLAYDRYRHAERQGMKDRLGELKVATPEILALEHEVNVAKLNGLAAQYQATLNGLEAVYNHQMASLDLTRTTMQLSQATSQLALMSQQYFGMDGAAALTGANTAALMAEQQKAQGRANRGILGWIGSFLTDPLGTIKYAAGGGAAADKQYAAALQKQIDERTKAGKGLTGDVDAGLMAQVRKLYAMGLDEQAQNLIKMSALGDPQRAIDAAKEDQQLLDMKNQKEQLEEQAKRLAAMERFESQAQTLREQIAAFEAASASHQYSADALREQNDAVKAALEALAKFEADNAREYADVARGDKTEVNIQIPEQDVYTREQMEALLNAVKAIPVLDARVDKLEAPKKKTAGDVIGIGGRF